MKTRMLALNHPVRLAHELDSRQHKNRARLTLAAGPWCWPEPDSELCGYALELRGDEPCDILAGEAALVAVSASACHGALALIRPAHNAPAQGEVATRLVRDARSAWACAQLAIARNLPLLTDTPHDSPGFSILSHDRGCEFRELDGSSFGLGFALSMASTTLGLPTRSDVIASATIDEWGGVGPVDCLEKKLETIASHAPRIKLVLLHRSQCSRELGELASSLGLTLHPVAHLLDALERAFSPAPFEKLIERARMQQQTEPLIDALFRLTLLGNQAQMEWAPVRSFAVHARDSLASECSPHQRIKLEFASEVAARHESNEGSLTIPSADFFESLPHPHRIRMIAHLVQQSADTGTPDFEACRALAMGSLPTSPRDAFPDHLRLMGALGRLLANKQELLEQAYAWQKKSALGWFELWMYDDLTYALSAMYQLSGAMESPECYEETTQLARRGDRLGGKGCFDSEFVVVYRAMALARLGRWDEARQLLEELLRRSNLREKVATRATRWLVYVLKKMADTERAAELVASIDKRIQQQATQPHRTPFHALTRALIDLDDALEARDTLTSQDCLKRIRDRQSQLIDNLLSLNDISTEHAPAFIQRAFPY